MAPATRRSNRVPAAGFLFLFSLFLLRLPPWPDSCAEAAPAWTGYSASGHLLARYTFRSADGAGADATDNDLFAQLRLDGTAEGRRPVEIHLLGNLRLDLDGGGDRSGFNPFEDIGDTGGALDGYLYSAYLKIDRPVGGLRSVRIGRQSPPGGAPVFFDGLSVALAPLYRVRLTAFGGVAAHLHDRDSDWGSDWLAGLNAVTAPTRKSLLRVDYLHSADSSAGGANADRADDLLEAELLYRFLPTARLSTRASILNGDFRELRFQGWGALPRLDLEASAAWRIQFATLEGLTQEFSPFEAVMGASRPFQSIDLKFRKRFGSGWAVGAGLFHRGLLDDSDEGAFNRSFTRVFGDLEITGVLTPDLDLVFTAEYWDDGRADFGSGGFDAGYRLPAFFGAELHAGTEFSLYRYSDYVEPEERRHVRTWYLDGRFVIRDDYRAGFAYDFEDGFEDDHTLRIELTRIL